MKPPKKTLQSSATPYLNARREWDERYGDSIARARSWRIVAIAALAAAGLAVAGVAYIGAQSKIQPFVVALDGLGNPVALAQPTGGAAVSQRIVEAQVANFIWDARVRLADGSAQNVLLKRAYALMSTDAASFCNDYFKSHSPFSGDGTTTNVEITSVLPISQNSYQVNWKESKFNGSQPMGASYWKSNVETGVDATLASNPQVMLSNPLGIYIKSLSWTQVLNEQQ